MSIVIAIATNSRVVMKCDGREMRSSDRTIVSEETIKFEKISETCIVGYTGVRNHCIMVVNLLKDYIKRTNTQCIQNIAIQLRNFILELSQSIAFGEERCSFIVAGIDKLQHTCIP